MHSNEDDNPLYLFIQSKPYPHAFGRKMHIVETSIHMSFLTTFGWLCFKGRWLGVSIYIVSTMGNGIFWNQKCTACLVPTFKIILLNTSFIILFNLVFAQTIIIDGSTRTDIYLPAIQSSFTARYSNIFNKRFSGKSSILFIISYETAHCFGLPKYFNTESRFPLEEGCVRN